MGESLHVVRKDFDGPAFEMKRFSPSVRDMVEEDNNVQIG